MPQCAATGRGRSPPASSRPARDLLRGALSDGALGVTLGVVYAPEYNYDADGFAEVLSPMREFPVPLAAHVRGEGDLLHESLREVIGIARRLGTPLHVSHLKCIGRRNWGRGAKRALEILEEARARGLPGGLRRLPLHRRVDPAPPDPPAPLS